MTALRPIRLAYVKTRQQQLIDQYDDIALGLRLVVEQLRAVDPAIAIPGKFYERRERLRQRHQRHLGEAQELLNSCAMLHRLVTYTAKD